MILLRSTALLCLLLCVSASFSSGGGGEIHYDLSGEQLRRLLQSPVYLAEWMERPLSSSFPAVWPLSHTGVRVTIRDDGPAPLGRQWLIHKGQNYGISSDTVVVSARHMSDRWEVKGTKQFNGRKTVSDFVKTGGETYNLLFANCHVASKRMMLQ